MKKLGAIVLGIVGGFVVVLIVLAGVAYHGMKTQSTNEDPAYWKKDIAAIEARYPNRAPDVDAVFIGSSSIRKWSTLSKDMAPYSVVNHGFGGSKVADSTAYVDRLVTPFSVRTDFQPPTCLGWMAFI